MTIDPQLLIFGGSLIAILVLAGIARWMKLGGNPALRDEDAVRVAASEVDDGFVADRVSMGRGGRGAVCMDAGGRIMVIKLHGNRFAGRILNNRAAAREEVDGLVIDTGEARFGQVRLSLDDSSTWADRINRL